MSLKSKLLLFGLVMILLSSFVLASVSAPEAWWSLDSQDGTDTGIQGWDLLDVNGTPTYHLVSGTDYAVFLDGSTMSVKDDDVADADIATIKTIAFAFNVSEGSGLTCVDEGHILTLSSTADTDDNDDLQFICNPTGYNVRWLVDSVDAGVGGSQTLYSPFSNDEGTWINFVWTINSASNNWTLYMNGVLVQSVASNNALPNDYDGIFFGMQERAIAPKYFPGYIRDVRFDDVEWGLTEALEYNTTVNGGDATGSVVIDSVSPENNTQFNTNLIDFNATINASTVANFNCSLYMNDAVNYTWTDQANTTTFLETNVTFNTDTTNSYFFNCTSGGTETTSDTNTFYIDTENPTIVASFTNGSVAISTYKNLTGQFNFSDTFMLYSYNISIDGVNLSNASNLGVLNYSYNLSYDVASLSAGIHTLSVRIADGHTAKEIPEYSISDGLFNNYLEYTFSDQNYIKIEGLDKSFSNKFTTEKKKDRYTFEYTPNEKLKNSYTFLITSSQELNIIETDSKYKNYLISGRQWLDFVSPENLDSKVKIKLNSLYEAEVTVSELKTSDKFKFNSIGELNIVEQNFTFMVVNATVTYVDPVVETQSHITSLNFDITGTGLDENNFTASLDYNGTTGTLVTTTDSATFVKYTSTLNAPSVDETSSAWFNWSVNVSATPIEVVYNHTIYEVNVGDCADHTGDGNWTEALNFLSLDEESNTTDYVNETTLNIDFNVWIEDEDVYQNFSFGFTDDYNYSVCIFPNSSTYLVSAVAEYFAPQMANRKYYLDNYYLNATKRTIYLYNLNESKASDITIRVYDKNTAKNVAGAFVKILRYYPENGSSKVVEIEKTDSNGYTLGKMVLADVFYKFIVETDRTVRLDTSVERIISLTKNLGIIEGSDLMESWRQINNVNTFVGCNNNTKKCTFTWSDTQNLVQTATLKVYKFGGYGKTLVNEQSTTAAAGTMTYTIVEDTDGNSYTASGYIETNTANSFYLVGEAHLDYLTDMHDKFGVSGVFPIMLLIIAVGAAFLETGAVGVIAGSLIGLIIMALTGFVSLSFTVIVTFIIIGGILIAKLRA